MSASGVVEVTAMDKEGNRVDPPVSSFLPLSTWLHELTAYNLMRRLPVFRTYLPRKMFRTWRNAAHARVYARSRTALLSSLFYAKPAFVSLLMDASRLIHGALGFPLMPFQGPKQVGSSACACWFNHTRTYTHQCHTVLSTVNTSGTVLKRRAHI